MIKRPPKHSALLLLIRTSLKNGDYTLADHALQRLMERKISLLDLYELLANGWHEKAKDKFSEEHQTWNYAIRSTGGTERPLRAIVSFEKTLLIITVIDLDA